MNYRTIFTVGACVLVVTLARAELPQTITTKDGEVYRNVSLIRTEPDGYLVNYAPVPNGMGVAKIKFTRLSPELQHWGNYNVSEAHDYELAVADANQQYAQQIVQQNAAAKALRESNEAWQIASATRVREAQAKAMADESAPVTATPYYTGITSYGSGIYLVPIPSKGNDEKMQHFQTKTPFQPLQLPRHMGGK